MPPNVLYCGDNLDMLRRYVEHESYLRRLLIIAVRITKVR
jgi:predicted GIY-YIG superfamily endonuclease